MNWFACRVCILSVVLTVGCDFRQPFDREEMLHSLSETVIIPTYSAFAEETDALAAEAARFCETPNASRLEALQAQWRRARVLWKRMDVVAFGPYSDQPWRIGPRVDSWPVREGTLEGNLQIDDPITLERVRMFGASGRGLPALEYLIFDPEGTGAALKTLSADDSAQRCNYVQSLALDLAVSAEEMVQAWSASGDNYAALLASPASPGSPFMSIRDATNEVVNRMLFLAENIQRLKLGAPLGLESGGDPQPQDVESPYSDHSIEDILANLDGLRAYYEGSFNGMQGRSVQAWVRWYSLDTDRVVIRAMQIATTAVAQIPPPLRLAVEQQRDAVQTAYDAVRELRNAIGVDMLNALSGTSTFNDTDGD